MATKSRDEIIAAASAVFAQYGFKRTVMADLAEAALMSRPALYLVFASKEEAFVAVVDQHLTRSLEEIRVALPKLSTPHEKLAFALDVWVVRTFQAVSSSPNAKDLFESSFQFAIEAILRGKADFLNVLAEILDPLAHRARSKLDGRALADLLFNAASGVKHASADVASLRVHLGQLLVVFLAGLGEACLSQ